MKKLISILLCATMLCAVLVVPTTNDSDVSTLGLIEKEDVESPEDLEP